MRIGLLTSGGDCPGLNAVIRSAVLHGIKSFGDELVGFRGGWRGLIDGDTMPLERPDVRGLSRVGGTILGTSRTHPYDHPRGGAENIVATMREHGVDALVAIGGEGTLAGARRLAEEGLPVVGVPKTIDNDLKATDYTFGFDTAVSIATDAMDRLRTTGESHHRCMVAEVMGRHVGWIALHSGMAAGAHAIVIPEQRTSVDQVTEWVDQVHSHGRSPLVVVAEGFVPEQADAARTGRDHGTPDGRGRGGIGQWMASRIEERADIEARTTTLGHIQRGGDPTGYDRVLATRFGMRALDLVHEQAWGHMAALRGTEIVKADLAEALDGLKTVPDERYQEAQILFGR